jgi:hypothetical protein
MVKLRLFLLATVASRWGIVFANFGLCGRFHHPIFYSTGFGPLELGRRDRYISEGG